MLFDQDRSQRACSFRPEQGSLFVEPTFANEFGLLDSCTWTSSRCSVDPLNAPDLSGVWTIRPRANVHGKNLSRQCVFASRYRCPITSPETSRNKAIRRIATRMRLRRSQRWRSSRQFSGGWLGSRLDIRLLIGTGPSSEKTTENPISPVNA